MLIKEDMKNKKKELVIELNMFSEWFCRGERGIDQGTDDIDVEKIRKVWDSREDGDVGDGMMEDLNSIEERIVWGDGGFIFDDDEDWKSSKRGVEGCMSRVDELLEGKSILIECEEEMICIGSKDMNEVEIDYCKFKIELLKN
jgi:hypothetical protein